MTLALERSKRHTGTSVTATKYFLRTENRSLSELTKSERIWAASQSAQAGRFELADLADRLTQALEARQKVINARPVQVIEHEPKADAGLPTAEVQDHSMVIPPTSRGGFGKRRF